MQIAHVIYTALVNTVTSPSAPTPTQSSEQMALLEAFRALLQPMAKLAIAKGLSYAALDELLRATLVDTARQQWAEAPHHGLVSRVSTATGLNRREVTRLLSAEAPAIQPKRWLAGEVFTRWLSDPAYKHQGHPATLRRQGPEPSFESLALGVTKDVHPRSLLEELCRLGMAELDPPHDQVRLVRDAMVPNKDFSRMVAFLADNVGDHLQGSVLNVLGDGSAHFDQAIFADELAASSMPRVRELIQQQWQLVFNNLVPQLTELIEHDQAHAHPADQQVRIGLYSYAAPMEAAPAPTQAPPAP